MFGLGLRHYFQVGGSRNVVFDCLPHQAIGQKWKFLSAKPIEYEFKNQYSRLTFVIIWRRNEKEITDLNRMFKNFNWMFQNRYSQCKRFFCPGTFGSQFQLSQLCELLLTSSKKKKGPGMLLSILQYTNHLDLSNKLGECCLSPLTKYLVVSLPFLW